MKKVVCLVCDLIYKLEPVNNRVYLLPYSYQVNEFVSL